jgi:hypothetical protein
MTGTPTAVEATEDAAVPNAASSGPELAAPEVVAFGTAPFDVVPFEGVTGTDAPPPAGAARVVGAGGAVAAA